MPHIDSLGLSLSLWPLLHPSYYFLCGRGNRVALPRALVTVEVDGKTHRESWAQGFLNCSLSQSFLRLEVGSGAHNAWALYYLCCPVAHGYGTNILGLQVYWLLCPWQMRRSHNIGQGGTVGVGILLKPGLVLDILLNLRTKRLDFQSILILQGLQNVLLWDSWEQRSDSQRPENWKVSIDLSPLCNGFYHDPGLKRLIGF